VAAPRPERRGHAEDHEERERQAVGAARHAEALAQEGPAHVREGARLGRRRVRRREARHGFEKVGDHWEKKAGGKKGPSDAQAAGGKNTSRKTAGGVDANATKDHLLSLAKKLGISGRSKMKKKELVDAVQKANNKKTADARKK
jgi:hypothetical protein